MIKFLKAYAAKLTAVAVAVASGVGLLVNSAYAQMYGNTQSVIEDMGTTTIAFIGDVVTNLWPLFLSLGLIAFAIGFILSKVKGTR